MVLKLSPIDSNESSTTWGDALGDDELPSGNSGCFIFLLFLIILFLLICLIKYKVL